MGPCGLKKTCGSEVFVGLIYIKVAPYTTSEPVMRFICEIKTRIFLKIYIL